MLINHFITKRKHPIDNVPDIKIHDNLDIFYEYMERYKHTPIGLDTENNGLGLEVIPLLIQFAFENDESIVIDRTSIKEDIFKGYENCLYVGANLQYDWRICKRYYNVRLWNLEDVMITEQIVGRGSGRSNALEAIHHRRLGIPLPEDKYTRNDFVGMTENSFFYTNHIRYAGYDPHCCLKIRLVQKPIVQHYNLERRVYDIGMPLIPILGEMCVNGFTLNRTKWQEILSRNKAKKFEIECQLDEIIRSWSTGYLALRGGIWTNKRKKQELAQQNFFGEPTIVVNENVKNVSYSSTKQLIKLFRILQEPIPKTIDKKKEMKWGEDKPMKESFAEEALEQYKIIYPGSRVKEFINKLLEYRTVEKAINSFGEIFLKDFVKTKTKGKYKKGYYNPKTQKVHTIYNQEATKNGRLSSGAVALGFYNSQQMIKEAEYRNCFTLTPEEIAEGWYISTDDLSAAELVILASNSRDKVLIKILSEDKDLHSYLCSVAYTKIFKYILNNMDEQRAFQEIATLLKPNRIQNSLLKKIKVDDTTTLWAPYTTDELGQIHSDRINSVLRSNGEFVMDKNAHVDMRDPAKNAHYGINYGATASKISETLNMAQYYSQLYLDGMDEAIPEAMAYLRRIASFGVRNGYVVFNERTNSRHWFKEWLEAKDYGRELPPKFRAAIERACKNYGISGTQSDMIKEGMVAIDKLVRERNHPHQWLLQVHDEIVTKHKDKDFGIIQRKILTDTCNLYLDGIQMKVSGHTGHWWHK